MAPLRLPRAAMFGDRPPLNEDERRLVLRAIVATVIPLTLVVVLVLLLAGWLAVNELRDNTRQAEQAAAEAKAAALASANLAIRLDDVRLEAQTELAWRSYDNCVENENQDAVNDALFVKVAAVVRQGPSTRARDELLDALADARSREPENEPDCEIPPYPRPPSVQRP